MCTSDNCQHEADPYLEAFIEIMLNMGDRISEFAGEAVVHAFVYENEECMINGTGDNQYFRCPLRDIEKFGMPKPNHDYNQQTAIMICCLDKKKWHMNII